jgi:spore coat protein CotH
MVEYLATPVELRHWDSGGKNFYVFRDASSTGRWQILSWDLDGIFSGGSDTKGDFITPDITGNKHYKSLFEGRR